MRISKRAMAALTCGGIGIAVLGVTAVVGGQAVLEKVLQRLATPVGVIWLGLAAQGALLLARGQRTACGWSLALWLTLTLLGNGPLVQQGYTAIERPFAELDLDTEPPFDTLIVLGGGAVGGGQRRPQLSQSGDRIVLAAQLYHAGRAGKLICTGERIAALSPDELDPAEQAETILKGLGVPGSVIARSGGQNTSEEIRQIASEGLATGRVGLVTSAWHMPRVMGLAQRAGLELEPVPADFQGAPPGPAPDPTLGDIVLSAIPTAEALAAAGRLLKELLAIQIGR